MSKCRFSIDFGSSATQLVSRVGDAIGHAGGSFSGDSTEGSFELSTPLGTVKGTYTIENSVIHIHIEEKPILVSCNKIESELRRRLA